MLIANSHIVIPPQITLTIDDISRMATNRGMDITESDRMLKDQHLYKMEKEVGLWTFDELKKYFLH